MLESLLQGSPPKKTDVDKERSVSHLTSADQNLIMSDKILTVVGQDV